MSTGIKMEEFMEEYRQKDKEVKSRCRADKERWFEGKLAEAEQAAVRNDSRALYMIVKDLSGKAAQKIPINGADGKPLSLKKKKQRDGRNTSRLSLTVLNQLKCTISAKTVPTHWK